MKVTFESKGDFNNLDRWLKKVSNADPTRAMNEIAKAGERSLAARTPKDTGRTAAGWTSKITKRGSTSEISWLNTAHPGTSVNIAVIIDQGHGTGTGGYVPPRPYIRSSMDSIFRTAGDKIARELTK